MTAHPTADALSSSEIEQAALGAVLFAGAYQRVADILRPEHFYDESHARVFAVAGELAEAGRTVNALTVGQALGDEGLFSKEGGTRTYLASLAEAFLSPSAAKDYASTLRDLYQRRQIDMLGAWMQDQARQSGGDAIALAAQVQAEIDLFNEAPTTRRAASLDDVLAETFAAIDQAQEGIDGLTGVPSGLADLDRKTGGFQATDLIIIAGRPSMGKTVLATTSAMNAVLQGYVARFQSLEMGTVSLGHRLLAARSAVSVQEQRRRLTPGQRFSLEEARRYYAGLSLTIDADSGLTVAQIRARARAHKRRHGLSLLVVDYLGLIAADDPRANRVHQVEQITKGLKEAAKELDVPVVLLSQLSRQVEQREDKRPQLADLRDSGSIEQDADVVMFVYREHYYLERAEPARRADESQEKFNARYADWQAREEAARGVGEIILAKNRQGEPGSVRVRFDGRRQVFQDLEALP